MSRWDTEERQALRHLAREVVAKEVAPHTRRRLQRAGRLALPVRDRPAAHVRAGSPELVERFLRPTLAGQKIGALGITESGGGSDVAGLRQFQCERLALAVQAYATAQRCLDLTISWVRDRQSFGKPLAARQVVRHKLALMARLCWTARVTTRAAYEARLTSDAVDGAVTEVSMAKVAACQACDEVVDLAAQLHGGFGYLREAEVERHYRDSRILRIGGGTDEIMDEVVSKRLGV